MGLTGTVQIRQGTAIPALIAENLRDSLSVEKEWWPTDAVRKGNKLVTFPVQRLARIAAILRV
jgi:hypothetical protein